jgi:hypothetical protein
MVPRCEFRNSGEEGRYPTIVVNLETYLNGSQRDIGRAGGNQLYHVAPATRRRTPESVTPR